MECVTGRILKNVGAPENIHGMEQLHKHDQVLHLGAGWAGDAVLPLLRPELPPHRLAAGCSPPVPPALPAAAEGQVRPGGCPQKGACRQEARRQEGSAAAGGARG